MDKLLPKHEIVIDDTFRKDADTGGPHALSITIYSEDAKRWIEQEAPAFGKLQAPMVDGLVKALAASMAREGKDVTEMLQIVAPKPGVFKFDLLVERCYEAADVVKYLIDGYNEQKQAGS